MKNYFALLFVLTSFFVSAQEAKGKLFDANNNPIAFANILLFDEKDSTLKATALSDTAGFFSLILPNTTDWFYISIQYFGIKPYVSERFLGNYDFGDLVLNSSSFDLDAVEITVKKPMIEVTGRGLIMNVSESPILKGTNSKEILEKIPGAVVNQDGSVTLKGKQNVQIFIDGKPTNLSLQDLVRLLESTPSTEIERVEVYETPPAKFDAAGNAGIINFVTKKGKLLGYNGNLALQSGYGNFHKLLPSGSVNYRNKKINAFGSSWYFNNMFDHKATMDMNMIINNQSSSFFNQFHRIHHPIGSGARLGLDYFVNDKITLGYLANLYQGNMYGWEPSSVRVKGPAQNNYDFLDAIQDFNYYWYGHSHNINVKNQISNDEFFNIDADFARRTNGNETSNNNQFYLNNNPLNKSYILQKGNAISDIFSIKADYEKKLLKEITLSLGAKASYVVTDNDFKSFNGTTNLDMVQNFNASNVFKYKEAIFAAYGTVVKTWKELWTMDLGLRLEQTNAHGISATTDSDFYKSYLNLFPNIGLAYKVAQKYSWSGSATRRIDRPNYYQLNPFQAQTNPFNIHQGNPNLNPQTTDVVSLTYGLKDKYFFTLSAANTSGLINQVIQQKEDVQQQIQTSENLDNFYNYSFNINTPFKIKKWWNMNWNALVFYNKMSSNLNWGVVGYEIFSFNINMQQSFSLPKGFKLELSGYYNHDSYWNIWFVEPFYQLDFGINKSYKKFNFNLVVKDFLNIREGNGGVFQGNIYMPTTYKPESRVVLLNISYRFGNQKIQESRRRSTGSEDLQKRAND